MGQGQETYTIFILSTEAHAALLVLNECPANKQHQRKVTMEKTMALEVPSTVCPVV